MFVINFWFFSLYRPKDMVRARTGATSLCMPELHEHDAAPAVAQAQTPYTLVNTV
jgi:hypothetical protein